MHNFNSELSRVLDAKTFDQSFRAFLNQADENANTGRGVGGQTPYGFIKKPNCDGADVCTHYGQGGASKTPYLNWWVVSIYYMPENGNIVMGIEEDRYPHLYQIGIKPVRFAQIGNKKIDVAVFYATTRDKLDCNALYENFMSVCEEVMRLGLK